MFLLNVDVYHKIIYNGYYKGILEGGGQDGGLLRDPILQNTGGGCSYVPLATIMIC